MMTIDEIKSMMIDPLQYGFIAERPREAIVVLLYEIDRLNHSRGDIGKALMAVRDEILSAIEQYPYPDGLMCALTEEVGELARAMMSEPRDNIRSEAIQVAATAIRIAMDGDPTLDGIRAKRNADAPFPPIPLYTP